ncbi:MAG: hypothetical protein Q8M29_14450 [Bacteroidota bacterium]|nr:hypothetical protein [Bacteroidota bacterium]
MIRIIKNSLLIICAFTFIACGKKINTVEEFNTFISNPDNGFKVSRSVNNVLVSVIYTPPEYVALKEMESNGFTEKPKYDSLLNLSKSYSSFVMILGPDESKDNKDDIMYKDLKNFKEYVERALTLNFDLESKVNLMADKMSYAPVLSSLENTYGLSKDRKVNFVFAPINKKDELEKVKKFDFVYSDESFDIGILHFEFDKNAIENNIPRIEIKTK